MAVDEKNPPVTFGASIERSSTPSDRPQQQLLLRSPPSHDSAMSAATTTPPADDADAAKKEWTADVSNPYSAFYKHPEALRETRQSVNDSIPPAKTYLAVTERDLKGGVPLSAASTQQQSKTSVDGRVKECTMWPTRQAVLEKRKSYKRKRGCAFFHGLTTKQRMWVKIIIGLVVIAAAVGLGVGISRAVGGGVWAGNGQSRVIPHD